MKNLVNTLPNILTFIFLISCSQTKEEIQNPGIPEKYNNGEIYSSVIYPLKDELFSKASYRIWIPDGVETIEGIVVHQHGCGRNGLSMPYDLHWQALAKKWNFALMGTQYIATDSCSTWYNPFNGSQRAFKDGLYELAQNTNHPELNDVPWLLWGHSGGGRWVMNMLTLYPDKVIAAFVRSGVGNYKPDMKKIPVVFNYGIDDMSPQRYYETYRKGRDKEAFWTMALDSTTGHNCGNSRLLAIPFFDEAVNLRLKKNTSGLATLSDTLNYWLGDPSTGNIYEEKSYKGDKKNMTWLISESFARKWQEFVRTGWVTDDSPPEKAPYDLTGSTVENTARIFFRLDADVYSGVKDIILFRDDQEVKKYIGPNDSYNEKHFQYANYGDEPVPESLYENVKQWIPPVLKFVDYHLDSGKKYRYSISFTNWSDLESPISDTVTVQIP